MYQKQDFSRDPYQVSDLTKFLEVSIPNGPIDGLGPFDPTSPMRDTKNKLYLSFLYNTVNTEYSESIVTSKTTFSTESVVGLHVL